MSFNDRPPDFIHVHSERARMHLHPPALLAALALALAGCVAPAGEVVDPAAEAPLAGAPVEQAIAIAFEGSFGPGAWACPPVGCFGQSPATDTGTVVEHEGAITGADLTMTWSAATPAMQTLRLGIMWTGEDEPAFEAVEGPSPLVLQVDGLAIPADAEVHVWAWVPSAAMGMLSVHAPQDFAIEGDIRETLN